MPTLYRQLKKLPWAAVPAVSDREHGPRPSGPPHHQGRTGAGLDRVRQRQVAQLRRTVTKEGKKTVEVVYLITSDCDAGPSRPGLLVPPLGNRKPSSLGQGRDLSRGQIAGQDGKRASRDGDPAQPGHQLAAPGRPDQHRRRQPPPRPRPSAHPRDNAGELRAAACCQAVWVGSRVRAVMGNGGPVGRVSTKITCRRRTSVARSVCHLFCCHVGYQDDHGGCGGVRAGASG